MNGRGHCRHIVKSKICWQRQTYRQLLETLTCQGIVFNRLNDARDTQNEASLNRTYQQTHIALKEILDRYNSLHSTIFTCFIDASKAFDRVNHQKLFIKLHHRGVPKVIIRILVYWYAHQSMQVKWGDSVSEPFYVGNGVRQGGILSPFLFNVYMDELSQQLNACNTGCVIGNSLINQIGRAHV